MKPGSVISFSNQLHPTAAGWKPLTLKVTDSEIFCTDWNELAVFVTGALECGSPEKIMLVSAHRLLSHGPLPDVTPVFVTHYH